MLCDPRIRSRNYGEVFITSLPPMPITRDLEEVVEFYRKERRAYREEDSNSEEVVESDSDS